MSTSTITLAQPRPAVLSRVRDFVELTKPRIAVLELVVVLAAMVVATWGQPDPQIALHAIVGTLLIAASASAANQWLERHLDGRMSRTADRPLPAGRMSPGEALAFAVVTLVLGTVYFVWFVNLAALGWALATWLVYVAAYTPLKTASRTKSSPV